MQKAPKLKVAVFESGNPLEKRKCPIDGKKVKSCINCKTCAIMSGFGGAGAFSDGKYNITNEKYKHIVVTRTGYSQRILALYNLYMHSNYSSQDKKRILSAERNHIQFIKKQYYPLSLKRRLFISLLTLPVWISHHIFQLIGLIK